MAILCDVLRFFSEVLHTICNLPTYILVAYHTLQKPKVVVIDYIYGEILIIFALIHFSEEKCCNFCNLM